MSNLTTELDTPTSEPAPVALTTEQLQAVWNVRQSVNRLKGEMDNYTRVYAGLTGDAQLIASVGLLGALLGVLRERCRVLEVQS